MGIKVFAPHTTVSAIVNSSELDVPVEPTNIRVVSTGGDVTITTSQGLSGRDGVNGVDGVSPILRIHDDYIQISTNEGASWTNFIQLAEIQGPRGAPGADGHTPQMRIENGYLQVRYFVEDEEIEYDWVSILALAELQGAKGDKGDRGDDAVIPSDVVRSNQANTLSGALTVNAPIKRDAGLYLDTPAPGIADVNFDTSQGGSAIRFDRDNAIFKVFVKGAEAIDVAPTYINAIGQLLQNGNQVWHAGNFTPGGGGDAMRAGGNTFTGGAQIFAPGATGYASIRIGKGVGPTSPTDGDMWRDSTGALYLRKDTATRSVVTNDGATFAGRVVTAASAAGAAGLNIPAGTAPTSPSAGDLWGTTTGLFYRTASATLSFMPSTGGTFTGKVNLPASTTSAAPLNLGQSSNTPTSPVNGDIWIDDFGFNYQYFGQTYQVPIGAPSTFANNTWGGLNTFSGPSGRISLAAIAGGLSRFNMASGPSGPTTPAAGDIWNLNHVLKFRKASTTVDVITSDVYDSYYQVSLYLPSCPAVGTDIKVPLVANSLVETSGTLLVGASNAISGTLGFDVRTNYGSNLVMNWTQSGFMSPTTTAGTADTVTASNWIVIRVTAQDAAAGAIMLSLRLKRV